MPGLVPGIHVFHSLPLRRGWPGHRRAKRRRSSNGYAGHDTQNREEWMRLRILGAAAAVSLMVAPHAAHSQADKISDKIVKIGVLTDMSGPASDATGPGSLAAARMAVEDFGG